MLGFHHKEQKLEDVKNNFWVTYIYSTHHVKEKNNN